MPRKHPFKKFVDDIREGIENRSLTLSGWLQYVKKIPDEEISLNMPNLDKLREEYQEWLDQDLERY